MSEPTLLTRILKAIEENLVATIGLSTVGLLGAVWTFFAPGVYRQLYAVMGDKGIVAALFALLAVAIWSWFGWHAEKRKEKPFFERLVPVPNGGYSIDPKNGEAVCPRCATEERKAYMLKVGENYYCQACQHAVKGVIT